MNFLVSFEFIYSIAVVSLRSKTYSGASRFGYYFLMKYDMLF